jgi:hypothetical protein
MEKRKGIGSFAVQKIKIRLITTKEDQETEEEKGLGKASRFLHSLQRTDYV